MHLGLALPQRDGGAPGARPLSWATVVSWARAAEAAGLGSVWMGDSDVALDPLTALAGVARATTSVRLGALALSAPRRPPAVLAKIVATLDVVSAGRLTLDLAPDGHDDTGPEDVDARGGVDVEGLAALAEALEVLRQAFTGEAFSFAGRYVHVDRMRCRPRPVQRPGPPLWVHGDGDAVFDLVARGANGWSAPGWSGTVAAYRGRAAALDRACEAVGRDPAGVERCVRRLALVGEDEADLRRRWERACALAPGPPPAATLAEFRAGRLVGTVDQVGEQLASWAAGGVTTLVAAPGALPFGVTDVDGLELLASAVPPR